MACQSCESERVVDVGGKSSDMGFVQAPHLDYEHDGYLPDIPNVCSGDYTELTVCLECGQVQGEWPAPDSCIIGIDADDDLHGFTMKEIKKVMDEQYTDDLDDVWEYLMDRWGGDTPEDALANKNKAEAENKKKDVEREQRIADSLAATRGIQQYYKVGLNHMDNKKVVNPNTLKIYDALKDDILNWFDDNDLPCVIDDDDDKGEFGSFSFSAIEDKMKFMKQWK